MMLRRILSLGLLTLLLPSTVAAAMPLYDRMKRSVEDEVARFDTDRELIPFLQKVFEKQATLSFDDTQKILKGDISVLCGEKEGEDDDPITNLQTCAQLPAKVRRVGNDEERIRSLARNLQITASSFELPLSDLPGRSQKLSTDLRGIINIWSAGTGSIKSAIDAPLIRTVVADPATFEPLLMDIGGVLNALPKEQRIGAVWRYQYGVRLLKNERAPRFSAPSIPCDGEINTERQYLSKCWPNLENALMAVWNAVQNSLDDPNVFGEPLGQHETAYFVFSKEMMGRTLPDNVIVWARIDGNSDENRPYGDIGLQWEIPLEPVLPSLMEDNGAEAILGGRYPGDPLVPGDTAPVLPENTGLCTGPISERGYLCRPYASDISVERCPDNANANPDEIPLTYCTNTGSLRTTVSGADVCREIAWKEPHPFDPNTQCRLTLRCTPNCTLPGGNQSALTSWKDAAGNINICFEENSPDIQNTYLAYHELAHAYQFCGLPPGPLYKKIEGPPDERTKILQENTAACCRIEGEAYRAQCDMMEQDGVFDGVPPVDGIPLNAETCAESWTNASCGVLSGMNGCYTSRTYTKPFTDKMLQVSRSNPKNLPATCSAAIDPATMDLRVAQLKEAVEVRDDVCAPGQVNVYKNRIGNNACFIGQCVEQSIELHRIAGGQTPAVVSGEIAPWDSPLTGTPLGNVLSNPPLTQARLPRYRPQLLMRELETALCQLQGLPPMTPPILCAIDSTRQLELTRVTGAQTALGLVEQKKEQELNAADLLSLSQGVGSRMGTGLYGNYLRESNQSFAGILEMATTLLEELKKIDFPTQMCPVGPALPAPINP